MEEIKDFRKEEEFKKYFNENYLNNSEIDEYMYKDKEEVIIEVVADGFDRYISYEDMMKICTQITKEELEYFGIHFDPQTASKINVYVTDEFLSYVRKKTNNPKYIPSLVRVKTLDYDGHSGGSPNDEDDSNEHEYGHLSR